MGGLVGDKTRKLYKMCKAALQAKLSPVYKSNKCIIWDIWGLDNNYRWDFLAVGLDIKARYLRGVWLQRGIPFEVVEDYYFANPQEDIDVALAAFMARVGLLEQVGAVRSKEEGQHGNNS